jgi:polyisoprenyl-phosphate glycosyltransferase
MESTTKPLISVVIPVYGCKSCLRELCCRIVKTIIAIPAQYEIILVNDASPDYAWDTIKYLSEQDERIKGIDFARNFGQHHAITAGLDYANGDWVVVMDCDLQDKPEEIANLYKKAQEGYEVVFGKRTKRQDNWLKKKSSQVFYRIYDYFSGQITDPSTANFSINSKKVIMSYRRIREQNRYFPLFIKWMGYKAANIPVEHHSRKEGKSSYSIRKLIDLATDAIISQSNKPLRLSIQIGFLMSFVSFIYAIYLFFRYFFLDQTVQGWTSVMVSIFFIGGLIFFNFGILGLYIGKIFNETKGRPLYLIRETTDETEDWR